MHLITSRRTVSSTFCNCFRLPPFATSPASNKPRASMPLQSVTNSSIQARSAVDRCIRSDIRCLTSLMSAGLPLRIPSTYHLGVLVASVCALSPPDELHQLLHSPPVVCGCIGCVSTFVGVVGRSFFAASKSVLERGECEGDVEEPQPTIEKRFMIPESPVNCGTRRGMMPFALAGL